MEREVTLADIVLGLLHRSGGVSAAVPLGERAPRESRHSFGHRPEAISQLALEPTFYIRGIQKRSRGLVFMRLQRSAILTVSTMIRSFWFFRPSWTWLFLLKHIQNVWLKV